MQNDQKKRLVMSGKLEKKGRKPKRTASSTPIHERLDVMTNQIAYLSERLKAQDNLVQFLEEEVASAHTRIDEQVPGLPDIDVAELLGRVLH